MLNTTNYQRYQRQIILKDFGEKAQQKLLNASVLVIGAGGLGCPVLQYLAAAGVGRIGIADDDTVSLTNLHRQVLYTTNDIGFLKADIAAKRLLEMNPDIKVEVHTIHITNQNALALIDAYDYVIDGTDNFASRYLINDACVLLGKPLIYGAVSQFEGQVAVFNSSKNSCNYRDLFPKPPAAGTVANCAEAGVLGVLPGIIGTMQANETIKLITGIGKPLIDQIFSYNALNNNTYTFNLSASKETAASIPKDKAAFKNYNYEWFCNTELNGVEQITIDTFKDMLNTNHALIIDVREADEKPFIHEFEHIRIPLSQLEESIPGIENETLILFCQTGRRSLHAAKLLSATFGQSKKIYSLRDGILNWKQQVYGDKEA